MEDCQCSGSRIRPACHTVIPDTPHGAIYNTHEDVSRLIFTRDSASKYLGPDVSRLTTTTTTTTTATNKTFTLFPLLLPEICREIWRFALSVPRLIVISSTSNTISHTRHTDPVFVDYPPLPSCFLACHESRHEALQMYDKCVTTGTFGSPMFYFNFGNDRILLGGPDPYININYLTTVALPNNAHKVLFLHISWGNPHSSGSARGWARLRERFTGLKELIISIPDNRALHPYSYWGALYPPLTQVSNIKSDLYDCVNGEGGIVIKQWNPIFQLKFIRYANPEKVLRR